jgi:predicted PurR-regulated permease PerM
LRGQLSVMLVLGALYGMALWAIGLDVGPLIGMFAGLISFVPYLGAMLGVIAGLIAAWVQFGDWLHLILVLVVFGVGHAIEGYELVPRLIGDKIGLHPVAVMFAILAGGQLFGFLGVLVALPVASVVMVVLRHAHARYKASELYGAGQERAEATFAAEAAMVASAVPASNEGATPDDARSASVPDAPPEKPA